MLISSGVARADGKPTGLAGQAEAARAGQPAKAAWLNQAPAVRQAADPARLLYESIPSAVMVIGRGGHILHANSAAQGILGHLRGPDLMPVLLNAADRPLFLGSRPTPVDGADGYPAVLDPLL